MIAEDILEWVATLPQWQQKLSYALIEKKRVTNEELDEIYEIFKKLLFIDILVLFEEISYFTESFRFPSGHHSSVHLILNGIKHIGGIDSINGVL